MTKRETLTLLRKVQRLQVELCGKIQMNINTYISDDNGKGWFTYDAKVYESYIQGTCYEWRNKETNLAIFERFVKKVK